MKIGFNVKKIYETMSLAIENMMNSIGITLANYEENINKNASNIGTLQTNIQNYESRILQNEVDIERIDGNVSSCNTAISELATRVSALENNGTQ